MIEGHPLSFSLSLSLSLSLFLSLSRSFCNWRVAVRALSTAKISRRCERALMRFEGKLAGMERRTSYRSWDVYRAWILHRSGFDDAVQRWESGREEGESGKQGWCRLLSCGTPEPRSPLRAGPATPVLFRVARARKCMKTSTHSPSPTSAKLHDLRVLSAPKLFPANRKNSPLFPANPLVLYPARLSIFCIVTFSRLTRCTVHCFNRIASILNHH